MKTKTKALIGLLILSNILLPFLAYVYASNGGTFTISSGVYPHAVTYTISKENSNYYAKDAYGSQPISNNSNATTLINSVISVSPIGSKIFFKPAKYSISGIIQGKDRLHLEGESKALYQDYSSATIFDLTTANAHLNWSGSESLRLSHITIQGNNIAKGIVLGGDNGKSAGHIFTDVYIRNCTYGIYNGATTTTGFFDSAFYSCQFQFNDVGVELKELMNNFYQCIFSRNKVAVEYGSSTTGFFPLFEGCVWSGNDYDFKFSTGANAPSLTVRNAWFENEGQRSLGMGNGNLFTNDTGFVSGTKGISFENCYISEYTHIDIRWIDYPSKTLRIVTFERCNFQGWNNLTYISLRNSAYYPHFIDSWRLNTSGYQIWLLSHNSGQTTISDGGTIEHELVYTPTSVIVTTSIGSEFASVTSIGASTFTVAIKKDDGSAGSSQIVYWIAEYDP